MANAKALALKGIKFADAGCRILDFKSDVLQTAMKQAKAAQKAMLRARRTAEEFVDSTTLAVKRHPVKAVCCTFGAAFAIGTLAGWFVRKPS